MSKYSTEVIRRVYDDGEGRYVEVGPDDDGGGLVELRTTGENVRFYGAVRMALPAAMAAELGRALLAAAGEAQP